MIVADTIIIILTKYHVSSVPCDRCSVRPEVFKCTFVYWQTTVRVKQFSKRTVKPKEVVAKRGYAQRKTVKSNRAVIDNGNKMSREEALLLEHNQTSYDRTSSCK